MGSGEVMNHIVNKDHRPPGSILREPKVGDEIHDKKRNVTWRCTQVVGDVVYAGPVNAQGKVESDRALPSLNWALVAAVHEDRR
jgi:hypothetical protein